MKNWSGRKMILNICRIIQTKSWIFLSIISLCVFFSNGQRMVDTFIIQSGDLLDSFIINNEINIFEMTAVQLLAVLLEYNEFLSNFKKLNNDIFQAEISKLGDSHGRCQAPPHWRVTKCHYQWTFRLRYGCQFQKKSYKNRMLHTQSNFSQLKFLLNQSIHI